jgi:nitrite reductase/ring-hydroxylating ferredoxin subunit
MAEATDGAPVFGCAARRAVLAGLASAGVVTLAGCASSTTIPTAGAYNTEESAAPGGGQPRQPASGGAGGSGAAKSPGAAKPGQKAPPASQAAGVGSLVQVAKVPVGGGVKAGNVLVVQPQQGVFRAFDTTCPHAGVAVGAPSGGVITCPAHDSKFKVNDGSRISGPAARGLKQVAVKVQNGYVVRA